MMGLSEDFGLSIEDIKYVIASKLKNDDFEFISCENPGLGGVGTGFLSTPNKACIKYKTKNGIEELKVFIKRLPTSPYHRYIVSRSGGFQKEISVFTEFLNELQYDFTYPRCFMTKSDELLVLEDLTQFGFQSVNLGEPFSLEHCENTLKSIARIHSASFIFEKNKGSKLIEHLQCLATETILSKVENHPGRNAFLASLTVLRKLTDLYLKDVPQETVIKALNFMKNIPETIGSSKRYPNVLTHGDLWWNNIMFRYDQEGKVVKCCIIDFQLATYKSPAYDVLMVIYFCTSLEFRAKHETYLKKYYFNQLSQQLSLSNIRLENIFSWEDFENMCIENIPFLLALAPCFLHFVLVPEETVKEFMGNDSKFKAYYEEDRSDIILKVARENEIFRHRVLQSTCDLYNYFNTH